MSLIQLETELTLDGSSRTLFFEERYFTSEEVQEIEKSINSGSIDSLSLSAKDGATIKGQNITLPSGKTVSLLWHDSEKVTGYQKWVVTPTLATAFDRQLENDWRLPMLDGTEYDTRIKG